MVKDRKARRGNELTTVALANLIAVLVDTMRRADVSNDTVHYFLSELEQLNKQTLYGGAAEFMSFLTGVLRGAVASND